MDPGGLRLAQRTQLEEERVHDTHRDPVYHRSVRTTSGGSGPEDLRIRLGTFVRPRLTSHPWGRGVGLVCRVRSYSRLRRRTKGDVRPGGGGVSSLSPHPRSLGRHGPKPFPTLPLRVPNPTPSLSYPVLLGSLGSGDPPHPYRRGVQGVDRPRHRHRGPVFSRRREVLRFQSRITPRPSSVVRFLKDTRRGTTRAPQ